MNKIDISENLASLEKENNDLRIRVAELSDFIENGSVPLHWVNEKGIIVWANQAELDLLGYKKEEYIGYPISDFHQDTEVIEEILTRLIGKETIQDFPARLKCKNGSLKYVVISSNVLFKEGKFIHSRCFTKDVTPLVEEEKRKNKLMTLLEESEERLRLAIEATDLGTWDWDFEENRLYISEQTKKMLGLHLDQLNYQHVLNLLHPDDQTEVSLIIKDLNESISNNHFDFTCRILKCDQKNTVWIRVQGSTYMGKTNKMRRIIGSVLDITELKNSETKNAELAAIVNSSNDAIVSKTLDGIVTSWNAAAEQLFGFNANEIIGQPILKLIPEDLKSEEDHILKQLRAGESLKHFETIRRSKNGQLLDVSLTISPIKNSKGQIFGISKIARDISEKKQEERRKNDFISMVSHELKTPLTSILLFTQILQKKYNDSKDELGKQMSTKIETQSKKMIAMIRDFLSLARIEENQLQINKEPIGLLSLFEEVREEAQLMISKHNIKFACTEPTAIFADRDKIAQVFNNLISNAIKYSPAGGTITIGCEKQHGKVKMFVSDQGIGIAKDDQKKLFNRFYRVENDEIAHISGFGIGLYIVSEILRYHDSVIQVESEKGYGTTFYFSLDELTDTKAI
jgi:PAS domain S-box-containing protein